MVILRAFGRMLPQLEAEELLQRVNCAVLGSGRMDRHDAGEVIREWERIANAGRREPARRATPEQLAAMGIGVLVVEPQS